MCALATTRQDGTPHLVPIAFALLGDRLATAVDHKPKRSAALLRLENVSHNPSVSLLVDHYEDEWERLWWVRADGRGRVVDRLDRSDVIALQTKYPQYRDRPPEGPGLVVAIESITGWTATAH